MELSSKKEALNFFNLSENYSLNGKEEEYLLKQQEKLNLEKNKFKQVLEKYKNIYNSNKEIILICDKYLTLSLLAKDLQELDNYRKDYFNEIEKQINSLRQMKDFNFKIRKNAFANAYSYYLHQFINRNDLKDTIRATKIYLKILNLIENCQNHNELENLLNKIQLIKFKDLNHDENLLFEIEVNYPIFINKYSGVKVFLIDKDLNTVTYSRNLNQKEARISLDQFNYTFISLEDFMKNSYYVGDKIVEIHDKNGYIRQDLLFQSYLYYDYTTKLMLLYSNDVDVDKFNFVNISFSKFDNFGKNSINQRYFKVLPNSNRKDIEDGIYKDKDFVYQSIISYYKEKNRVSQKPLPKLLEEKANTVK